MVASPDDFRNAMRQWASGVAVVTTRRDDGIQAITVSSFCSLSLDPPLVLICIDRSASCHDLLAAGSCFAVNILKSEQVEIAARAAGKHGDRGNRLEGVSFRTVATGAPVLDGCLGFLDCALVDRHGGGDHTIFVGRVEVAGSVDGRPLLFYDRGYRTVSTRGRGRKTKD